MFQRFNKIANKKISKEELRREIEQSQINNEATPKLMEMIYIIAHKVLRTNKFRKTVTIDWMEDAASECVLKFALNYDKFDLSKTNKYGESCSPYAFYMTSITRSIYDTLNNFYYKWFDLKRNLMQYNSCFEESDPYCDDVYDNEDTNNDKDYIKTFDDDDNIKNNS